MSSARDIELAQADVCDCHDRVALLRASLYRWGLRPNPRLHELQRELQRAEQRLRDVRSRQGALTSLSKENVAPPPPLQIARDFNYMRTRAC